MVNNNQRCVIISASPQLTDDFVKSKICKDDFIICADGGADTLIKSGIQPNLVAGDFDSSKNYKQIKGVEIITLSVKKDDTDTMYCVRYALNKGFKNFLFLGSTGGRIDHTLANLSILLFLKKNGAFGIISDEYSDVFLLESGNNEFKGLKGKTVSVMPFACESVCLSYSGMSYPLNRTTVTTDYPFSISNVASQDNVTITLHSGTALLVLPTKE